MSLAARQALLADYLTDPAVRERVRADPEAVAGAREVDLAYVRWLVAIEPRRLRAFETSRAVKDRRRRGEGP